MFDSCQISATVFLSFQFSTPERERERERPALFPFPKSADHLFYQGVFDMCFDSVLSAIFIPCEIRPDAFFSPTLMKLENSVKICDRTIAVNYSRKRFFLI